MRTSRRDFIVKVGVLSACTCTGLFGFNSCGMVKGISKVPALPDEVFSLQGSELIIDLTKTSLLKNKSIERASKKRDIRIHCPKTSSIFVHNCVKDMFCSIS
jgi:hypothetical protein